jgi:hypothetical protein
MEPDWALKYPTGATPPRSTVTSPEGIFGKYHA